ncbi:hypothetical protein L249_4919 [Ophiocordyceps polyrhachis-furcata BCC 54312]|uniref:RRM domain-containing protein n=1 Tax=Ophiocordyceps polyrhachis-furcata BCC 54312 TaxID=1330021 RepID=A0A367L338_9HYPO|nr:hypothetical protein L249_4919 [Ophiocordyceps polyrhachis-furcata BCC 54312]
METQIPISTVYVQNIEERVKPEAVIKALQVIFSEFGKVVDIVAKKNLKARGQAFVVFDSPQEADNAISEMDGFELFGKAMRLSKARTRSDKSVEMKCTEDELAVHKRRRQAEKDKRTALQAADNQRQLKRGAPSSAESRPTKLARPSGMKQTGTTGSTVIPDEYLPPNKILFVQNVSEEYDVEALTALFSRFDGFREIRLVPGRRGIAFVEYEAEQGAIAAKENVAGLMLGTKAIKVTYQRQ